ncbi:hypothetical protein [Micromonospora sp. DT47]|uniref:hypothetical protein n=1 Tax=Micromonospora sp. DT47 TaxID=3393431 RepID=UPI003CE988CD
MDFWDATKVMMRRWYMTLPLLLLTIAGTGFTATAVEADYVLTSYVQLIPPQTSVDPEEARKFPVNPWNLLGLEALSQAANYTTVDQTFLDRLEREGYSTSFKITSGDPVAGATIEVIGESRAQAIQTTETVITRYRESALALQTQYRVRSQDLITVQRLDQGENLKRPGGKVKRAIIAVFGTGMLIMCGVTIGGDALLRRRRLRRQAADGQAADEVDDESTRAVQPPHWAPAGGNDGETVRTRVPASIPPRGGAQTALQPATRRPTPASEVPSDPTIVLPTLRRNLNDEGGNRR